MEGDWESPSCKRRTPAVPLVIPHLQERPHAAAHDCGEDAAEHKVLDCTVTLIHHVCSPNFNFRATHHLFEVWVPLLCQADLLISCSWHCQFQPVSKIPQAMSVCQWCFKIFTCRLLFSKSKSLYRLTICKRQGGIWFSKDHLSSFPCLMFIGILEPRHLYKG